MGKQVKVYESIVAPKYKTMYLSIFSYLNDYHLCWEINQKFDINLTRYEDFAIVDKEFGVKQFSVYGYTSEVDKRRYILISNKSDNGPLVIELPKVDYFFRVTGCLDGDDERFFSSQFRSIDSVITTVNARMHHLTAKGRRSLNEIFENFE